MSKWNRKFYRDKFFWMGLLCLILAGVSAYYFNYAVDPITSTKSADSSELVDHVNEKIQSISELREVFAVIQVGEEKTGEGGSTQKEVNSLLGSPNMKGEDYLEGEKMLTYTWHQFPWESPMPMLSVSYNGKKVVNKSLYFSSEKVKDQEFNQENFDALQLEENYTREDLVQLFGNPDMESVAHSEMGTYEYYTWFRSQGIYNVDLRNNQLKEKKLNTN